MARENMGNNLKGFIRNNAMWYRGKYHIFLVLILCLCAGCAAADFGKEDAALNTSFMAHEHITEIQGELQWSDNFSWIYCSQEYEDNGTGEEEIGYFEPGAEVKNVGDLSRPDDARVLVFRQEPGDTPFDAQIEEEIEKHSRCLIDLIGNTELTLAIRLEAEGCYELHLQQDGVSYTLQGIGLKKKEWYRFLEELLLTSDLHWGERDAYTDTVFPMFTDDRRYSEKDSWWLQFDGELLPIKWDDLISCTLYEDGLRICFYTDSQQEEESVAAQCLLHHGDEFPAFETEGELYDWFKENLPSIRSYTAYPKEEVFEEARESEGENPGDWISEKTIYREMITEEGQSLVYLTYQSMNYEFIYDTVWEDIWDTPFDHYDMFHALGLATYHGVGYEATVSEDGLLNQYDNLRQKYYLQQEIGEEVFSFAVERVYLPGDAEKEPEQISRLWKISVYRNGENEAFQEIEVWSAVFQECPVSFYDFNADGFQDLVVDYYYGANGGSESHYLWSPSRESFVYFPDLDYYGSYYVDPDTRRLHIHYHGSAISGSDEVYQWKNEMDCELIKDITYYPASFDLAESMVIKVTRYDGGREEILSDYTYSMEEYEARHDDIWGIYREDFIWEQDITDESTGKRYMLRYAQPLHVFEYPDGRVSNYDFSGQICYDGKLYVFAEDTYLITVIESEFMDPYDSISWEDWDGDGERELVIRYKEYIETEDNVWEWQQMGRSVYRISALITPDWQPE